MLNYSVYWDGGSWTTLMIYEVISKQTNQRIATLDVAPMHDTEKEFNGGRFTNFSDDPQEHKVTLPASVDGDEFCYRNDKYFNWIADQTDQKWSFDVDYRSMGDMDVVFTFEDVVTATMFKLVWYGRKW